VNHFVSWNAVAFAAGWESGAVELWSGSWADQGGGDAAWCGCESSWRSVVTSEQCKTRGNECSSHSQCTALLHLLCRTVSLALCTWCYIMSPFSHYVHLLAVTMF